MILLRYNNKFRREPLRPNIEFSSLTVNICKQRIFRLIDLAHEIIGVKVAQNTWHKLLDERQHATESSHIASTKEAVADDTACSLAPLSKKCVTAHQNYTEFISVWSVVAELRGWSRVALR